MQTRPVRLFGVAVLAGICLFLNAAAGVAQQRPRQNNVEVRILTKLEEKLGKPLTLEQRKQVNKAVEDQTEASKATLRKYQEAVAGAVGLSVDDIKKTLGSGEGRSPEQGARAVEQIESKLGRKLTSEELNKIREAGRERTEGRKSAQENFTKQLSEITGISEGDIAEMMPAPGGERGGSGRREGPSNRD